MNFCHSIRSKDARALHGLAQNRKIECVLFSFFFFLSSYVFFFLPLLLLRCLRDRFILVVAASSSRKDKLVRTSNRDSVKYNQTRRYLIFYRLFVDSAEPMLMYGFVGGQHQHAACSSKIHFWGDSRYIHVEMYKYNIDILWTLPYKCASIISVRFFARIKCKCVWGIFSASKMLLSHSTFASLHIVEPLCNISIRADRISCQHHRSRCRRRRHFMLQNIILAHFLLLFYFSGFGVVEFFFRHLFSRWIHRYFRSEHFEKMWFVCILCMVDDALSISHSRRRRRVWISNGIFLTDPNFAK